MCCAEDHGAVPNVDSVDTMVYPDPADDTIAEVMVRWLDFLRASLLRNLEGLNEGQARPSSLCIASASGDHARTATKPSPCCSARR